MKLHLTPLRSVLWIVALVLIAAPLFLSATEPAQPELAPKSAAARLLGPISEVAARVQWIRVQRALNEGRSELALARAETALELNPADTEGWRFTAVLLALDLGSPNREPSATRRRALIRSALKLLVRGEASAEAPDQLALWRGIILLTHAEIDPELEWPGGEQELWTEAALAFEAAAELGSSKATDFANSARENARVLEELAR